MTSVSELQRATFKKGSTTYFNSSLFFPAPVRRDVTALYAFVRIADDLVDSVPQRPREFEALLDRYRRASEGRLCGDPIVDGYVELARRRRFDPQWTEAFLHSMQLDLSVGGYDSLAQTLHYIYGSAEVIGLFMARILDLPETALLHARMLGRAMQYINFIRDIDEDNRLNRRYLPLAGTDLESLSAEEAASKPESFVAFVRRELDRFAGWQQEAEKGFRYLPRRYLVAIKTASDMYKWTARRIAADPFVVFSAKVKPPRSRIILRALMNAAAPRRLSRS